MNSHYVSPENSLQSGLALKKTRAAVLMTVFFLISSVAAFAQSPEIRKAFRFIDIEQPSKGLAALEQLVNANPTNSNYLYYLGLAQLRTGAKDKALATFEKGIAANEKDGLNYAGKGYVRLLEKNPTDAKAQLDKALAVSKSKDANVLKAVGEAYLTDTKYLLDAINVLNKAKSINGTDPDVHMLLGDAFLIQNPQNAGETVSSYERAAKADPKYAKPHYKIGKIYLRSKSNDIAIESFNKALAIDPEYAPAYKDLGELYYTQKEAAKAVQAYEKYLSISETPGQAKYQYAFFLFMAKDFQKANAIFKEVTTNPNVSPIALRYYAYSLTEQSKSEDGKTVDPAKTEEARKAFEQYFQKAKPEDILASDYAYYGKLQLALKTPVGDSLANESFAKSLAMDSAQTEVLQLQGDTYFKRKKFPEAIAAYKSLMNSRKQPLSQDLFAIGRAYYYNQQFAEADSAFTKLAERTPNIPVGFFWAGKARRQIDSTGVQALANPMYDSAIEKASATPEKYKRDLIDAYEYLGSYYINIKPDIAKAKSYYEKILTLDPSHPDAKTVLKEINKPAPKG
jgi:tetratricopeptide (TPR) repeat protein